MTVSVAICCIALNEDLYIDEWLDYHFGLGFNHVYVYDNSPEGSLKLSRNNVTVIHFPGSVKQVEAYNNFMDNFSHGHDWCAFIDVDEFFVLKKHKTIQEYLKEFGTNSEAIGVNWLMFGSGGQEKYEPRPVMERFTVPSFDNHANQHIKSIVRLSKESKFIIHPHRPQNIPVRVHKPGGCLGTILFDTDFNPEWDYSVIQLNHYFCKSREEFELKIKRGRADTTEKRTMAEFIL